MLSVSHVQSHEAYVPSTNEPIKQTSSGICCFLQAIVDFIISIVKAIFCCFGESKASSTLTDRVDTRPLAPIPTDEEKAQFNRALFVETSDFFGQIEQLDLSQDRITCRTVEQVAALSGLNAAPTTGIYHRGQSTEHARQELIIRLPRSLLCRFPEGMQRELADKRDLDLFVIFQSEDSLAREGEGNRTQRNVFMHGWVQPTINAGEERRDNVLMSACNPRGTSLQFPGGDLGLTQNCYTRQPVRSHPQRISGDSDMEVMALSPDSAKYRVVDRAPDVSSFYFSAVDPKSREGRATAALIVTRHNESVAGSIRLGEILSQVKSVNGLLEAFDTTGQDIDDGVRDQIKSLLTPFPESQAE